MLNFSLFSLLSLNIQCVDQLDQGLLARSLYLPIYLSVCHLSIYLPLSPSFSLTSSTFPPSHALSFHICMNTSGILDYLVSKSVP